MWKTEFGVEKSCRSGERESLSKVGGVGEFDSALDRFQTPLSRSTDQPSGKSAKTLTDDSADHRRSISERATRQPGGSNEAIATARCCSAVPHAPAFDPSLSPPILLFFCSFKACLSLNLLKPPALLRKPLHTD